MDSSISKCFDCKHCIDAVAAGTVDGVIESKFGFYRRFAVVVVAAPVVHRLTANHRIGLTDLIRDVDRLVRFLICHNRSAAVVVAQLAVGFEIYLE